MSKEARKSRWWGIVLKEDNEKVGCNGDTKQGYIYSTKKGAEKALSQKRREDKMLFLFEVKEMLVNTRRR